MVFSDYDDQGDGDEMGEDELDMHASIMVERAVRLMTSEASAGLEDVINEISENGFNFLHTVIYCGAKTEIAEMLLSRGANPNVATAAGEYPLHLAAEIGDVNLVRCVFFFSPFRCAFKIYDACKINVFHLRSIACRLLVHYGADLRKLDSRGCTPLQLAIDYGHVSSELFIALGHDSGQSMHGDSLLNVSTTSFTGTPISASVLSPSPTPRPSPMREMARSPRILASPGGGGSDRTREEHMRLLREALAGMTLKDQYALTLAVDRNRSNSISVSSGTALNAPMPSLALPHSRSQSMTDMASLARFVAPMLRFSLSKC